MKKTTTSTVKDALLTIRTKFIENLIPTILAIEDEMSNLQDPNQRERSLTKIGAVAHKIAGIAGSIGYEELGKFASDLDISIRAEKTTESASTSYRLPEEAIETFLNHLEAALDEPSDVNG